MITTICLNPSFDRTVEVDSLQIGQVNRVRNARVDLRLYGPPTGGDGWGRYSV